MEPVSNTETTVLIDHSRKPAEQCAVLAAPPSAAPPRRGPATCRPSRVGAPALANGIRATIELVGRTRARLDWLPPPGRDRTFFHRSL
jgi:hypothetical protein